jgi:hypothetical protein
MRTRGAEVVPRPSWPFRGYFAGGRVRVCHAPWRSRQGHDPQQGREGIAHAGTGDADLYVRRGAAPSTSSYDCRPYKSGSAETCSVTLAAPAVVNVMVRGYSASSTFTLTALP